MKHTCHAYGCATLVSPKMLMCSYHWRMIPYPTKRKIWANYRVGQCDDMKPSREWIAAAKMAVAAVKEQESQLNLKGDNPCAPGGFQPKS